MNAKRTLAILLTVVLALGCFAGFTFTSAADSIKLTDYATFTWGYNGASVTTMNDGDVGGYFDLGFWGDSVNDPAYGTAGTCYIEADLGTLCTIETLSAWTLTGRNYKWDAYITADNTADISTWTKVDGKTSDDECTSDGYTVTLGTPVEGRYIRFYGMYNNANAGFHFTELQATGTWKDANANLEQTAPKPVTEPTETTAITVKPSPFGQWENWSGKTNALVSIVAGENNSQGKMLMEGVKDGTYSLKVTLTDETEGKTYIIPEYCFDSPNIEFYIDAPTYTFFRFAFTEYNIPLAIGNAYTIALDVFKGDKLLWTGATEQGMFSDWTKAPEIIINDVPHDYVEPGEEPDVPVEPEGPTTIEIVGKFGSWENWPNSPNKGDAEAVTQLLVGITAGGETVDISADLTWELTIVGGDQEKTITLSPATKDLSYNLYRFETCLAEGDNQFVPVNGVDYTVTINVYDGEELVYASEATSGFVCPMDPIVPGAEEKPVEPEGPVAIEINPYENGDIKGFENWSDQTQLLIRVDGGNTVDYSGYTWKITITDGETSKTITMAPSSDAQPWLYRFETCLGEGDNQFIPQNGTEYTVSVEILDDAGEVIAKSQERAGFIPFQEPIVPETDDDDDTTGGEDDNQGGSQTGDAAVYATIAVAVAAVALAVVFKKRSTI